MSTLCVPRPAVKTTPEALEAWRKVWREAVAPVLSIRALSGLRAALVVCHTGNLG
jgi:hypothetical protein